jgi:hypothetical protein
MVQGTFRKRLGDIPEFGSVKNAGDFSSLLQMSAYHHVMDGTSIRQCY